MSILLPLNLQFFSADTGNGGEGGTNQDTATQTPEPETQETNQETPMIPKTRFDEVNTKMRAMEEQLKAFEEEKAKLQQAEEERQKAEAEKRGEFEELYRSKEKEVEGLLTFKQRAEALEGVINEMVDSKLQTIPEDYHDLIPSNLSAEEKLSWINKAEAKGMFKVASEETSIGESTNPKHDTKRDVSKMSAMEKLFLGYGKR
ncbi:hypothetical protein MOD91_18190 [Bacillus haynesii]|uniref:hypothetical protein n=1 Tax=Bacillus haynesii TaxID=1925021 RepID=UPI0022815560|nr:hypothetical protein [Bacillus haynesii]MCY8048455.1 hypothetical protein [Bacillus haynesii]MCY8668793.1 hypothetical protein [Bacillus haynesii]MCY9324068.1 hypothetical protein [Bacillus haynesii]